MAIFKMVSGSGKYQDDLAIPNLIAYITDGNKAKGDIIGGCNIDFNNIAGSMVQVSEHFKKNSHIRADINYRCIFVLSSMYSLMDSFGIRHTRPFLYALSLPLLNSLYNAL